MPPPNLEPPPLDIKLNLQKVPASDPNNTTPYIKKFQNTVFNLNYLFLTPYFIDI